MTYFDFHTHQSLDPKNEILILKPNATPPEGAFCLGLHPWWINDFTFKEVKEKILALKDNKYFLGIGETGIDRSIETPIETQTNLFKQHIDLAEKVEAKVIVLHCVRAYSDIIPIIKNSTFKGIWIFHDFNANTETLSTLLKFNTMFSLGDKLFRPESKGHKSFPLIPLEKLLLETDDQTNFTIEEVYKKAAALLNIPLPELTTTLKNNKLVSMLICKKEACTL